MSKTGIELIAAERERQLTEELWTAEHDDHHVNGELAQAAACYAWPPPRPLFVKGDAWPWDRRDWKPEIWGLPGANEEGATDREKRDARVHVLTKAGALIAAEIDRLQRIEDRNDPTTWNPSIKRNAGKNRQAHCS